ncbi:hypothetical protein LguiA_026351 [Lonicera macranthoides]
MLDLVHDLPPSVPGKAVSHVKYDTRNIFEGTRHLLFSASRLKVKEFPHFVLQLNKVQLFSFHFRVGSIRKTFLDTLIKTFIYLRLLELSGSEFEELPSSIGTLMHFRFLSINASHHLLVNCSTKNLNRVRISKGFSSDILYLKGNVTYKIRGEGQYYLK